MTFDAIALSHDAQLGLVELTHKTYAELWPGHPLRFRVPSNGSAAGSAVAYLRGEATVELVPCRPGIKDTMAALLDGIPDGSWVFWCIDDRFPTSLDIGRLGAVVAGISACGDDVEEVKLFRWREPLTARSVTIGGVAFLGQKPGSRLRGFWHHHFVRAGLLRRVFLRPSLVDDCHIHDVLPRPMRAESARRAGVGRWRRPHLERELFLGTAVVPVQPMARLAEPLVEGRLTTNGVAALRRWGCEIPPYPAVDIHRVYE